MIAKIADQLIHSFLACVGVPKGAMLTHGNLVADSAGMIRVSYVAPGVVRTAFGEEEQSPGHQFFVLFS